MYHGMMIPSSALSVSAFLYFTTKLAVGHVLRSRDVRSATASAACRSTSQLLSCCPSPPNAGFCLSARSSRRQSPAAGTRRESLPMPRLVESCSEFSIAIFIAKYVDILLVVSSGSPRVMGCHVPNSMPRAMAVSWCATPQLVAPAPILNMRI